MNISLFVYPWKLIPTKINKTTVMYMFVLSEQYIDTIFEYTTGTDIYN